ncbi:hypothetical protein PGT21_025348 [Puccinia graminis f. sp. tritici]|uniref:Uncharacterized protein n=1 Tax=Puccinia graminis f. sp. tritici TaxID=56615 RepID=A0A5B0LTT7_PUCGR|nr:hypothetical protein PGTUg99_020612 [Puccinia graminis f. sp. tritici]KAA1104505.1 hypothetical protein PGT21_025348 [Puccinia graminis f. sp. tritici]
MPTPSRILCAETQLDEESIIDRPPRKAPIHLDYSLYVKHLNNADFPHAKIVAAPNSWSVISPLRELGAMSIDMQSMTWKHFQALAINHLGQHQPALAGVLSAAKDVGALHWLPSISGHDQFGESNMKKNEIRGHLDFLAFATEAYDVFPNKVVFKVVMLGPMPVNQAHPQPKKTSGLHAPADGVDMNEANKAGAQGKVILDTNQPKLRPWGEQEEPARTSLLRAPKRTISSTGDRSGKHAKMGPNTPEEAPTARAADDPFEIEVIQRPFPSRPVRNAPTARAHQNANAVAFRSPLGPAGPKLEAVDMETYLTVAHIDASDHATRRRLNDHGIVHWSFFRRATEEELLTLGFPIGTARLLCEGVPRLEYYVEMQSVPL